MDRKLQSIVEASLRDATGSNTSIAKWDALSGGSINRVYWLTLNDGRKYVLKCNAEPPRRFFSAEAKGLKAIDETETIRAPKVVAVTDQSNAGHPSFLILEAIETATPGKRFWQDLGHQLALLHQASLSPSKYGFEEDNFLGLSVQPNGWSDCWISFWCENRIGYQIQLAVNNGNAESLGIKTTDRFLARLPDLLKTSDDRGVLLHGDLWSGNFLCDHSQNPVLIDPAVYFGHREAEFGMTTLFGGFHESFYDAYNETWPMEAGYHERIEVYRLYHLLNHLNLFGNSYLGGCLEILKKYQ